MHWALLFISLLDKSVCYINPIGSTLDELRIATDCVNQFIRTSKNQNFKDIQLTTLKIEHQKQTDTYNCGVFVCYFFEILLSMKLDSFKNNIDINEYREVIKLRIKANSKLKVCCLCGSFNKKRKYSFFNSSELKTLNCGHLFHSDCLKDKYCIICLKK